MATLTLREVPDEVHERLKRRAAKNRRSLNSEAVLLLEQAIELLPDEAALRARYLSGAGGRTGSPRDAEYGPATIPVTVFHETATPRRRLDRRAVLELFAAEREHLRSLGVRRIGLFGSVLRGEGRPESDVDVVVEFEPTRKTFDAFVELASWLESALGRHLELVTTEGLSPYIGPRILEEAEFVRIDD